MSGLEKACLQEIRRQGGRDVEQGAPVHVQFNPATLKLTLGNRVEGGESRGKQVRQFTGKSSTRLSFDLVFDTAEEMDGTGARSVRERTAQVERFVLPRVEGNQQKAPPRVRFKWAALVIDGIISSLNIDFELFSAGGIPLRARMGVTIEEQDSKYQYVKSSGGTGGGGAGAGPARPGSKATPRADPDFAASGLPGSQGGGPTDRTAPALEGESVAEFATRMGVEPAAWRALARDVVDPLSLPGGQEISFSSRGAASPTLGSPGGAAAAGERLADLRLALEATHAGTVEAGLALTKWGGVGAALVAAAAERIQEAAAAARAAFAPPAPAPANPLEPEATASNGSVRPTPAEAASRPLPSTAPAPASAAPLVGGGAAALPSGPAARTAAVIIDQRGASWGFGIPLQSRRVPAADHRETGGRSTVLAPRVAAGARGGGRWDPTEPPWRHHPLARPGSEATRRAQELERAHRDCGCGGGCGCKGHLHTAGGNPCRCT